MSKYAHEERLDGAWQKVIASFGDSAQTDAFGRVRVSNPHTVFSSKMVTTDDMSLLWDSALESGAGITASSPTGPKPYIDFTSTLNTAGVYTRQTLRYFNYQPGKSQLVLVTGVLLLSGGGAGVKTRIGYFNDDNGLFFEYDGDNDTVYLVIRSNDTGTPIDTRIPQEEWSVDSVDGTGPSGIAVDWSKSQIFVMDFEWLGVGRVRFGLDIDGRYVPLHTYGHANVSSIPWASTANLPVRYQMVTTSSSPVTTMRCICAAVISEGGAEEVGVTRSHGTTQHVNANTADTWYALVGVRLKAGALGARIVPFLISVIAETQDAFEWALFFDPTVAGTFTYSDLTESACQVATGDSTGNPSTNTVTGGVILERGFGSTASSVSGALHSIMSLGQKLNGDRTTFVLAVRSLGSNSDMQGSMSWHEIV